MSLELLLAFVAACILLGLTPGPNMAVTMANTLSGGLRGGLVTLAGTTTGLAVLVSVAAAGMTSVMVFMSTWFDVIRWVGAVYLVYLGVRQLWRVREQAPPVEGGTIKRRHANRYLQGLLVSLSNPKVILFLGAFLPQFVDPRADAAAQLFVLAALFVAVLLAVDIAMTVAVAKASARFSRSGLRFFDAASGVLLLLGGAALAALRRP
jgi:homoserine/homoserine lactone efflux protein